jgi:hypothetical protein
VTIRVKKELVIVHTPREGMAMGTGGSRRQAKCWSTSGARARNRSCDEIDVTNTKLRAARCDGIASRPQP